MKIESYISSEIIEPRLAESGVVVVYDSVGRYRELCLSLSDDDTVVVDASEGSIVARETAAKTLVKVGKANSKNKMLLYVPTEPPDSREKKIADPFWVYSTAGTFFPKKASDEFEQICLTAKADYTTEIRKVFSDNANPPFELINNIGGGAGWPTLQSVLDAESTKEILSRLLVPDDRRLSRLNSEQPWQPEAKAMLSRAIGLELQTQQSSWQAVSDELWRFVLFSEFVFDLPEGVSLPASISTVPHAPSEAKSLIFEICDELRNAQNQRVIYIDKAQEIEDTLELAKRCSEIKKLGLRNTFPFESKSYFEQCVNAVHTNELDQAKEILKNNEGSVWTGRGENQVRWNLVRSVVQLVEKCADCREGAKNYTGSMEDLIFFYADQFHKVDRYHREFEQADGDYIDAEAMLKPAINFARETYSELASDVQNVFVKHLEEGGWPSTGLLSSTEIFDKKVAPHLAQSGVKVAYFMIDALRYELGVELQKELEEEGSTNLDASLSVIPTVTPIGMASLLPAAQANLSVNKSGNDIAVMMGDSQIKTVEHRMKWIESIYGQRFMPVKMEDMLDPDFSSSIDAHVELMVIRSSSVDARMETEYQSGLPAIKRDIQAIRVAVRRLREAGFHHAVIATDHGFCINATPDAADSCRPPEPTNGWKKLHDRCLLGTGAADTTNWVCQTDHLGLKSDYDHIGGPRSFACYSRGNQYFHGGASLQEAVVPCISIKLSEVDNVDNKLKYKIDYRNGAKKVTTLLPVFDILCSTNDLFSVDTKDVLLQAIDARGNVVGEPKAGGHVNPVWNYFVRR